jgi:hypothetical protein
MNQFNEKKVSKNKKIKNIIKYSIPLSIIIIVITIPILISFSINKNNNNNSNNNNNNNNNNNSFSLIDSVSIYNNKTYDGINTCENLAFDMEGNYLFAIPNRIYNIYNNSFIIYIHGCCGELIIENKNKTIKISSYEAHHHIEVTKDNHILFLDREKREFNNREVIFDNIIELNENLTEIKKWSSYENFEELHKYFPKTGLDYNPSENVTLKGYQEINDYFHINYISILPKNKFENKSKAFQEGNWLISLASINRIMILDKNSFDVVWTYGDNNSLFAQHGPIMLENGNILVFNNGYGNSEVLEINPLTKKIVWKYTNNNFYTSNEGFAQRLPNNNTLITESRKGFTYEVTPNKEIVWKWQNPIQAFDDEENHMGNYRTLRLSKNKSNLIFSIIGHKYDEEPKPQMYEEYLN